MSREANMNEHVQETAIDTKTDDKLPTATIIDNQLRNLNFISTNSWSLQPKILLQRIRTVICGDYRNKVERGSVLT